jgi:hypothetical protein
VLVAASRFVRQFGRPKVFFTIAGIDVWSNTVSQSLIQSSPRSIIRTLHTYTGLRSRTARRVSDGAGRTPTLADIPDLRADAKRVEPRGHRPVVVFGAVGLMIAAVGAWAWVSALMAGRPEEMSPKIAA